MSELIIKDNSTQINYGAPKKSGLAKWLAGASRGMLDEKTASIVLLSLSLLLIIFSAIYFFMTRPTVDTQKNFKPAITQ